jgi:hypothetical protein
LPLWSVILTEGSVVAVAPTIPDCDAADTATIAVGRGGVGGVEPSPAHASNAPIVDEQRS